MLGVPSSIHGWKERFFFVTTIVPGDFEVAWRTPRTNLNSLVGLEREEAESLDCLLECPCLIFELMSEETLVNASLSSVELEGNSRSNLGLVSLERSFGVGIN